MITYNWKSHAIIKEKDPISLTTVWNSTSTEMPFKFQSPEAADLRKKNTYINEVKTTDNLKQQIVSTEIMKTGHEKGQKGTSLCGNLFWLWNILWSLVSHLRLCFFSPGNMYIWPKIPFYNYLHKKNNICTFARINFSGHSIMIIFI